MIIWVIGDQVQAECQNETSESIFVYRRVCYFANWAAKRSDNISRLTPEEIDPFLCTHINFAFGKVLESLTIAPSEEDDIKGWTSNSKGMYERVIKLKETNPDLRVLLSVGGWTHASRGFNDVSKNAANIKTFATNSIKFLRDNKFDGLDLDWEYPGAKDQGAELHTKTGYTKLVKKLSEMFRQEAEHTGKEKLLLTCATAAARHRIEAGYEVSELCKSFDFVSVMTYDYHGSWEGKTGHNSPLYGMSSDKKKFREWNIKGSMNVWSVLGCPKEKLNIGLSAYGRAFTLLREPDVKIRKSKEKKKSPIGLKAGAAEAGKYTREAGVLSYYEICELIEQNPSNRVLWHREMSVPYVSSDTLWIGYDNVQSVKLKMKFLKDQGYGGVIIWSLDLDDKTGDFCKEGPFPLINAVKNELSILPNHASNANTKCFDDNNTLVVLFENINSQSTTITVVYKNFFFFLLLDAMDDINNRNNEYIKTELVTKLLKHFLPEDRSSRLSSDMVKYFTELIFQFIHQAFTRTIQQASSEGTIHVDIQHFEKILMQLLLDF
ncbi:unnamed protein product [Rotaria magnacalcarata]|uniref:GH18 domain-containing protein n=1 Tax=Rotaria magnacalcarata TaxID=392030 RepID=A0A815IJX6_9BILA|nr:unnamed protein product [Rotaria magnacalcarata]CAF1601448.1 unnamed protein product [Rotaria magnacalcarata]CAF2079941.1 unnamed protein product [Rotaria magnacalcarata]CAF2079943.1 unnamed protein product [Rotaria magnacalcarata]CAF2079945.1 unnamed protein product [Rotaria magnacalcarata]